MNHIPFYNYDQNPLDFLDQQLKGRARSSLDETDREHEIPSCQAPYIHMNLRRDSGRSNRSRRQIETYSPQHSPVRGAREAGWKLMVADDFASNNIDYLFGRDRLISDDHLISETCTASQIRTRSDEALSSKQQDVSYPYESSLPIYGSDNLNEELQGSCEDARLIPENCSLFGSSDEKMDECIDENLNVITNLQPVAVPKSAVPKEQQEDGVLEQSALLSMHPCPSSCEHEDSSTASKHRPKPNSPATMISHRVKRRKKTAEQIEYLRELYFRLGGEWDGKVRKEAMRKTGLSRIQVYKWFFDMKLQQQPKEKRVEPEVRVSYPPEAVLQAKPSSEQMNSGDFVP